eukprot:CAMPEP_0172385824 /NCGR_PEP_ID=MMETSP1061-20121228/3436_1 /TAXON_ID=37318 /ORGANISM="Pseudo-nitzschia pungens, Strain cf. pungens" /LENGTH=1005 /DNA_ID=CAMNT_0013114977 /DNA_START=433 /DNA_END=3450 /DNA_ORIENTATION=+
MDKSESTSSKNNCQPAIKIEDDDAVRDETRDAYVNRPETTLNDTTIPVLQELGKIEKGIGAQTQYAMDYARPTNTISSREKSSTDSLKGKGNNDTQCVSSMDKLDAIADMAAKSNLGSKRRKRPRSESSESDGNFFQTQTSVKAPKGSRAADSHAINAMSRSPIIVTASISNHYIPPRLISGTGFVKHTGSTRNSKNYDPNLGGNGPSTKKKVSVHMLNSVGLECSDDGVLRLEEFDEEDENVTTLDDFDAKATKTEDDIRGDENSDPSIIRATKKETKSPPWAFEEHKAFAAAIFEIGLKNCSPSVIMENMRKQPRYITRERTKSHLQKYRQTKERSKAEFLKEYDAFFKSTEKAKALLNRKNCGSSFVKKEEASSSSFTKTMDPNRNEPIPKAILTTALEGKKPSKLLGGKAAALLSYSVLNNFSTNHGPDQLQYKAAKLMEFPAMTEEEKRSSVGASLLQVKTLIDNMTDVLLKQRHGIEPIPTHKTGIGDDESDSSSCCSSDDGYSDDEEDNTEGVAAGDKPLVNKQNSKDQDQTVNTAAPIQHTGPFAIGSGGPVGPCHPFYRVPPTAYPAPFPAPVPPPNVTAGFHPPQYPHAAPPFYGGGPPHIQAASAPGFPGQPGFPPHPMHYPQDLRLNPYQPAPSGQVGAYAGAPPIQPNFYSGVAGYPAYYGNAGEGGMNPAVGSSNSNPEYPPAPPPHPASSSSNAYSDHSRQTSDSQRHQQQRVYDRSPSHSNDGRSDRRKYEMSGDSSPDMGNQRRAEKRSKRRRGRDRQTEKSSPVETRHLPRKNDDDFTEFLDRLSRVPSPTKVPQRSSSSPIQRSSRGHGRVKSSSSFPHSEETPTMKPSRRRSRQQGEQHEGHHYGQQFESSLKSKSYAKSFESAAGEPFSESEASRFASPYEGSPVDHGLNERRRGQGHNAQDQLRRKSKQSEINDRFWESSNFMGDGYNDRQQPQQQHQNNDGGEFHQRPAQPDAFVCESDHRRYGTSFSSPEAEPTGNYFFGE